MASPARKTLQEEHQGFVVKLKIKDEDGTQQIRRVRLQRIADGSGSVSYDELAGLVLTFTFPSAASSPEDYIISLTYFDVDDDNVTISSTDELIDAIEQFADAKVLRIATAVKPKQTKETTDVPSVDKSPSVADTVPTLWVSAESQNQAASVQQDQEKQQQPPPHSGADPTSSPQDIRFNEVLGAFAGVLAGAVNELQEGLASPPQQKSPSNANAPAAAAAPSSSNSSISTEPSVARQPDVADTPVGAENKRYSPPVSPRRCFNSSGQPGTRQLEIARTSIGEEKSIEKAKSSSLATGVVLGNSPEKAIPMDSSVSTTGKAAPETKPTPLDMCSAKKSPVVAAPANKTEQVSKTTPTKERNSPSFFIHGRHTCDTCLATPIIGKRYHATNLPDYDLCELCFGKYKGTEVKFEPQVSARDVAYQLRWQRQPKVQQRLKILREKSESSSKGLSGVSLPTPVKSNVSDVPARQQQPVSLGVDVASNSNNHKMNLQPENTPNNYLLNEGILSTEDDAELVSEYMFTLANQLQFVVMGPVEKAFLFKDVPVPVGYVGIGCKYCAANGRGGLDSKRFPRNRMDLKRDIEHLYNHILKCPFCPQSVKDDLMKNKRRTDFQILGDDDYLDRLWHRLAMKNKEI